MVANMQASDTTPAVVWEITTRGGSGLFRSWFYWYHQVIPPFLEDAVMSPTLEQLKAEAMQLTPDERADLADLLWISVASQEEVAAAWEAEIARRIADMDAGRTKWNSMEEVMTELRARIKTAETDAGNAKR